MAAAVLVALACGATVADPPPEKPPKPDKPADDAFPYGPRCVNAWHDAFAKSTAKLIADSGVALERKVIGRITLVSSAKSARVYSPLITVAHDRLADRFGEPVASALDPRSAYIVLLDTSDDYEHWTRAMFEADPDDQRLKSEPPQDGRQDPLKLALGAPNYLSPTMCTNKLSSSTNKFTHGRNLAYQIGYMALMQATEGKAPEAVQLGFANLVEAMVIGDPSVRTYSYEKRDRGRNPASWAGAIALRAKQKSLSPIGLVLEYHTATMTGTKYQEAWSLVSYLADRPRLFGQLLTALRDGKPALDSVARLYGGSADDLSEDWRRWVLRQP
jgi:hypothetical protein